METQTNTTDDPAHSVLLVEDDPMILDMLSRKFADQGWEVTTATTGEEGMQQVKDSKPEIIMLDILLPGINGHEVLAKLKEDSESAQIPVIVLSNYGEDADIKKSKDLGALEHFVKAHLSLDEVVAKAMQVLEPV